MCVTWPQLKFPQLVQRPTVPGGQEPGESQKAVGVVKVPVTVAIGVLGGAAGSRGLWAAPEQQAGSGISFQVPDRAVAWPASWEVASAPAAGQSAGSGGFTQTCGCRVSTAWWQAEVTPAGREGQREASSAPSAEPLPKTKPSPVKMAATQPEYGFAPGAEGSRPPRMELSTVARAGTAPLKTSVRAASGQIARPATRRVNDLRDMGPSYSA